MVSAFENPAGQIAGKLGITYFDSGLLKLFSNLLLIGLLLQYFNCELVIALK